MSGSDTRRWVTAQLVSTHGRHVVVVDPESVATQGELVTSFPARNIIVANDWGELRAGWERQGRNIDPHISPVVFHCVDPSVNHPEDLPFDIERSTAVCRVRVPCPPSLRSAILSLDAPSSDTAIERLATGELSAADAVVTAAAQLPTTPVVGHPAQELRAALRIMTMGCTPELVGVAASAFTDEIALGVLSGTQGMGAVQAMWDEWVQSPSESKWSSHVTESRIELVDGFLSGRLVPAVAERSALPPWAAIGIADNTPADRVESLLSDAPQEPNTFEDWVHVAMWWGEVRCAISQINPPDPTISERAWQWWDGTNDRFHAWLRSSYGRELSRSRAASPAGLHKVQPFLARRVRAGSKVLLLVLDGMAFAQWARIRDLTGTHVVESTGTLAMLPTLTEVSRQAIAAGALPVDFSDSLNTTSREARHWSSAWASDGIDAAWVRIDGAHTNELDGVPFGGSAALGLVISATDELMHGADLLGDVGLTGGVEHWIQSGVFVDVLKRAQAFSYEVWVTSDHGNVAVDSVSTLREGDYVERSGTRMRRYANKVLRDDSSTSGIVWDELPGYPPDLAQRSLFAPGRTGWGSAKVSHGGLSLDEVIVPFVRVEAPL